MVPPLTAPPRQHRPVVPMVSTGLGLRPGPTPNSDANRCTPLERVLPSPGNPNTPTRCETRRTCMGRAAGGLPGHSGLPRRCTPSPPRDSPPVRRSQTLPGAMRHPRIQARRAPPGQHPRHGPRTEPPARGQGPPWRTPLGPGEEVHQGREVLEGRGRPRDPRPSLPRQRKEQRTEARQALTRRLADALALRKPQPSVCSTNRCPAAAVLPPPRFRRTTSFAGSQSSHVARSAP